MSDEEILAEVGKYPAVTVILTGGEPSLWIDREFVDCRAFVDRAFQVGGDGEEFIFHVGNAARLQILGRIGHQGVPVRTRPQILQEGLDRGDRIVRCLLYTSVSSPMVT